MTPQLLLALTVVLTPVITVHWTIKASDLIHERDVNNRELTTLGQLIVTPLDKLDQTAEKISEKQKQLLYKK